MKWFFLIVLLVLGWFFFLKKNVTQQVIPESAPVKYTESLRHSQEKAKAVADQANRVTAEQQKALGEIE